MTPFDGDMTAYRAHLLSDTSAAKRHKATKAPKPKPNDVATLRRELRQCEARVEKLQDMLSQIDAKLADSSIYDSSDATERLIKLNQKRDEVLDGIERAENLWLRHKKDWTKHHDPISIGYRRRGRVWEW